MKRFDRNEYIFFAETADFLENDEEEKIEANLYLTKWKRNILRKLQNELENYELVDESRGERNALYSGPLCLYANAWIKLAFKKKLPYQLD